MKISFEGDTIQKILMEMEDMLATIPSINTLAEPPPREPVPTVIVPEAIAAVGKPVDKPVDKPKQRTAKQLENDERLRAAAKAKLAAKKTAKPAAPAPEPEPQQQEPFSDPADVVKLRQRTINDLQEAYANGHQAEVFELLSRFGDGAKSFRELKPEAFIPIREAIDSGALT